MVRLSLPGLAILLAGAGLTAARALAQEPPTVVAGMKSCLAVSKRKRRLECFERLARETIERDTQQTRVSPAKPEPATSPPAEPASPVAAHAAIRSAAGKGARTATDKKGSSPVPVAPPDKAGPISSVANREAEVRKRYGLKESHREAPRHLEIVITAAWPDAHGRWNFATSDGQIWRQRNRERVRLTRLPVKARLKKSLFGSYFLDIIGVPSDIRVERRK